MSMELTKYSINFQLKKGEDIMIEPSKIEKEFNNITGFRYVLL